MKKYMAIMKVSVLVEAEDEVSPDEIEEILHEDFGKNGYNTVSLVNLMIVSKSAAKSNSSGTHEGLIH